MADSIERFVADLAQEDTQTLVNQYAIEVPDLDRPGAAPLRCANLRAYLEPRIGAPLALIGEAPPAQHTSAAGLRPNGFTEHSATILRRAFEAIDLDPRRVILGNAVPFHPAQPDNVLRNRRPSRVELELGAHWLERFLSLMRPGRIAAVGQTARGVLPPGTAVIRHPANGGSRQLRNDLSQLAADLNHGCTR